MPANNDNYSDVIECKAKEQFKGLAVNIAVPPLEMMLENAIIEDVDDFYFYVKADIPIKGGGYREGKLAIARQMVPTIMAFTGEVTKMAPQKPKSREDIKVIKKG